MLHLPSITTSATTRRRTAVLGAVVAAFPVVIAAWSVVATPTHFEPMGYHRPDLFGIPLDFIVMVFAVAWGAIGGYVVGTRRSPWVLPVALMVFTLPACLVMIFWPAIFLVLQNAST
jgi:hypothetical protein